MVRISFYEWAANDNEKDKSIKLVYCGSDIKQQRAEPITTDLFIFL